MRTVPVSDIFLERLPTMRRLANLSVLVKITSVIVLIGVITAGGVWFATSRMSQIDDGYSQFLDKEVPALVASTRIRRNMYQLWMLSFRIIAETRMDRMKAVEADIGKAFDEFNQIAKAIKTGAPNLAAQVDALIAKVAKLKTDLAPVVKQAMANQNEDAVDAMNIKINPQFEDIAQDSEKIRSALDAAIKKGSDDLTDTTNATIRMTVMLMGAGLLAGIALAVLITLFGITRPIGRLVACMKVIADGKYDVEVPGAGRTDEVGVMAGAVEVFRKNGEEVERARAERDEQRRRAEVERKSEMRKLADTFQAAVGNIVDTVSSASTELEAAAGTLTKTAETTQDLAGVVASASEEASANVQSVASATEQLTGSVGEISRQVQESSRIAEEAVRQAGKTDARITELSQAASRIGDVVKLITAIAEQTNLLALNATIEAARAGEAGKGFAVVAQEVKALAAQTAKATDEIGTQITSMQAATQDSVAAIKEIGGTIARIAEIAGTIATAAEQQAASTQEIARNVQQAAQGTQQVASNITDVNRGASETGSASAQVLSSAQSLSTESNHLKIEVEKFLATVRAA
jgi:methyl-accepting chemotaxis protein